MNEKDIVGADKAALEAILEAMSVPESAKLLESLATALFPAGLPGTEKLTWPEPQTSRREEASTELTTEARLKAAEARFRTLVEQIPAVTFLAVLGEGKNEIYVSPHVEQMLGFTQKEWLENPFLWYRQLHPDDRELWNREFARGVRSGGPFRAECRFLARDGHVVWVHGEARIVRDELDRPMLLQGVAFDITESKRAQEVLLNEAITTAKIQEELAIARQLQTSILPRDLAVDGLEIAAAMEPADDVGGDYYDVLPFPGGAWLGIGDVSGHGLHAGLVMLMVQSAMATLVRSHPELPPSRVLPKLNELLFDNVRVRLAKQDHVTLSLLRYESSGRIAFAGAHEDILVYRARTRTVETVHTPGLWLGATRDIRAHTTDTILQLEPDDVLVLYTDGVTEAMDAGRRQFDIDRLRDAVQASGEKSPAELVAAVLAEVRAFMHQQMDDITLLAARYAPGRARKED